MQQPQILIVAFVIIGMCPKVMHLCKVDAELSGNPCCGFVCGFKGLFSGQRYHYDGNEIYYFLVYISVHSSVYAAEYYNTKQ